MFALRSAVLTSALVLCPAYAIRAQATPPDTLTRVSGAGTHMMRLAPTHASLFIVVDAGAPTVGEAASRGTVALAAVRDTLGKLGVPASDVSVIPYGVSPSMQQNYNGQLNPALAYTSRTIVRVRVPIDRIAAVSTAALTRGASGMSAPAFLYDDASRAQREATEKAIAAAREQAVVLAAAAGGTLGRMVTMNAPQVTNFTELNQQQYLPGNTGFDSQPKLVPEIRISVTISATWIVVRKP